MLPASEGKEGVGKAIGDAKLETEGAAQDAKGKVQKGIDDGKVEQRDGSTVDAAKPERSGHESVSEIRCRRKLDQPADQP